MRAGRRLSGMAELPLHGGKCPAWLFRRMRELAKGICEVLLEEFGEEELLRRVADPYWFQSFGCALGFDWHSSGLTTTTCAALKEALEKLNAEARVVGGKGKASRNTIAELNLLAEKLNIQERKLREFVRATKLSAKVDNSLVQDGFEIYHHSFAFTKKSWAVVQQGMNVKVARRYHWVSHELDSFVRDPHAAIVSDKRSHTLNLAASETDEMRKCSVDLVNDNPAHLLAELSRLQRANSRQSSLLEFSSSRDTSARANEQKGGRKESLPKQPFAFAMSAEHFPEINASMKALMRAYESAPSNYEELVLVRGLGKKGLRALALLANLIYGAELSWRDPVKYSFTHGGKDGWPFPVDKKLMEQNTRLLKEAVEQARIGKKDKLACLRRLAKHEQRQRSFALAEGNKSN